MTENKYFVTHSAGCCLCDSISKEKEDGTFEQLTYQDIVDRLNEQQELIQDLTCNAPEDNLEIKHINNIYKELGFDGVIEYAEHKLSQYGTVREVEEGLYMMATGGWSDNEHWIGCLNDILCRFSYMHYAGYERGGAFYYTREPHGNIKVVMDRE